MNYIEQINLLHMVRERDNLDTYDITLYLLLLHKCNRANWDNPVTVKNLTLESELGVTYKVLCSIRNRLRQSGLVKFVGKGGNPLTTYKLLTFEEMILARAAYYKNRTKDEPWDELQDELRDEPREEPRDEVSATNTKGIKNKTKTKPNQTFKILAGDKPRPSSEKNEDEEEIQVTAEANTNTGKQPIQNNNKVSPAAGAGKLSPHQQTLYSACLQSYIHWFTHRFGVGPQIDGTQGNALHRLIAYFGAQLPPDTPNEEKRGKIEQAFNLVLTGWDNLDEFTQKQTKLVQLSSNIQNIIVQLKTTTNATNKKQPGGPGYVPIWHR